MYHWKMPVKVYRQNIGSVCEYWYTYGVQRLQDYKNWCVMTGPQATY